MIGHKRTTQKIFFDKWTEDGRRKAEEFQLFRDYSEAFMPSVKKTDFHIFFTQIIPMYSPREVLV
jgi:hypothetical protein